MVKDFYDYIRNTGIFCSKWGYIYMLLVHELVPLSTHVCGYKVAFIPY